MKKHNSLYVAIYAIVIISFNLIVYLISDHYHTAKIVNLAFANGAILISLLNGLTKPKDKKIQFLGYMSLAITSIYVIAAITVSSLFMIINTKKMKVILVTHILILSIYIIFILLEKLTDNAIVDQVNEDQTDIDVVNQFIYRLTPVLRTINSIKLYKKVEKVSDALKSMIITREGVDTKYIDQSLMDQIDQLCHAILQKDDSSIHQLIDEILLSIESRNDLLRQLS